MVSDAVWIFPFDEVVFTVSLHEVVEKTQLGVTLKTRLTSRSVVLGPISAAVPPAQSTNSEPSCQLTKSEKQITK